MNLLDLQPNKVSRDLSGYITYIYGSPKVGKTTLAAQMDKMLLLAFEPGYHAIPGVIAMDITSWGEMKQVYRELKKPEVHEKFKSIAIDTIDIAADRCKKYILSQNGIDDLGELGYGKGWTKFKDEFNEVFRGLTQLGYSVLFIGHDKEATVKAADGKTDITVVRPALSTSTKTVIAGMSDIYGYAHQLHKDQPSVLTLRCTDGTIECGCRFKYIAEEIPMNYDSLVKAIADAIDKEAQETDNKFITDDRIEVPITPVYDFKTLMQSFHESVEKLMTLDKDNANKIKSIVDKYLGKDRKVADCTEEQSEQLDLIVADLQALLN